MFTREQLQGIMLAMAKPEVSVYRDDRQSLGYAIRLGVHFRANEDFLLAVHRSLLQHEVTSKVKDVESKTRPRPILSVGGKLNCYKLVQLLPKLPTYNDWEIFNQVLDICIEDKHTTRKGFDKILELKGLL